jgi:hypothetical protein
MQPSVRRLHHDAFIASISAIYPTWPHISYARPHLGVAVPSSTGFVQGDERPAHHLEKLLSLPAGSRVRFHNAPSRAL